MMMMIFHRPVQLTAKHEVWPGWTNWIWPETAFSLTPDSNQICPSSLQAWHKYNTIQQVRQTQTKTFEHHFSNLCPTTDYMCTVKELILINTNY